MRTRPRRRTIGGQRALGWRPKSAADIDAALVGLVDRVTRRLRDADRVARTVTIRLRFDDSVRGSPARTRCPRHVRHPARPRRGGALWRVAGPLIEERGLTLIGITLANLDGVDAVQLTLPFDGRPTTPTGPSTTSAPASAEGAVAAVLLHRDPGIVMPLLPDVE